MNWFDTSPSHLYPQNCALCVPDKENTIIYKVGEENTLDSFLIFFFLKSKIKPKPCILPEQSELSLHPLKENKTLNNVQEASNQLAMITAITHHSSSPWYQPTHNAARKSPLWWYLF